jgi:hypothetical protein
VTILLPIHKIQWKKVQAYMIVIKKKINYKVFTTKNLYCTFRAALFLINSTRGR